jgi:hypothetical protein
MADSAADHVEEVSDASQTTSLRKTDKDVAYNYGNPSNEPTHTMHTEPWRFESFIPGGYSQPRMLRFKNPSTMYKVINLFAGTQFASIYTSL